MLCSRTNPKVRVATLALAMAAVVAPVTALTGPAQAATAPVATTTAATPVALSSLPAAARAAAMVAQGRTPDGRSLLSERHTAGTLAPHLVGAELTRGQSLGPGDSITAPGARYSLVNDDGTIVLRTAPNRLNPDPYDRVVLVGTPGSNLAMQSDGNLVLYAASGGPLFDSGTNGTGATRLVVQDDGNLVIYGPTSADVFFNFDTLDPETLTAGGVLLPGDRLDSRDGSQLVMQTDGNLVLYNAGTVAFASSTSGAGNAAVLQADGNFVVYDAANRPLFSTGTGSSTGADTVLVLTSGEFRVVNVTSGNTVVVFGSLWSSDTLLPGYLLAPGDRRTAVGGGVIVTLQADGNFVKYNRGVPGFKVVAGADLGLMQPDGNFVLYRFSDGVAPKAVFNTKSSGNPGSRLVVQSDNNLVVYTPDNRAVFFSKKK